jgi:hypothetical protein
MEKWVRVEDNFGRQYECQLTCAMGMGETMSEKTNVL